MAFLAHLLLGVLLITAACARASEPEWYEDVKAANYSPKQAVQDGERRLRDAEAQGNKVGQLKALRLLSFSPLGESIIGRWANSGGSQPNAR